MPTRTFAQADERETSATPPLPVADARSGVRLAAPGDRYQDARRVALALAAVVVVERRSRSAYFRAIKRGISLEQGALMSEHEVFRVQR